MIAQLTVKQGTGWSLTLNAQGKVNQAEVIGHTDWREEGICIANKIAEQTGVCRSFERGHPHPDPQWINIVSKPRDEL